MKEVATFFDNSVKEMLQITIDPTGNTIIPTHILHDDHGMGAPHYSAHLHELFGAFKHMSISDDPNPPRIPLTTRSESTVAMAQADCQWMFYDPKNALTPAQFVTALCIRLGVLPSYLKIHGSKCNCGYIYSTTDCDTIDHILTCDLATPVTHTTRHNEVRDAIIQTCRSYGITTSKEPTCFNYSDGKRHRPDALFHTLPLGTAIDVSMVSTFPAEDAIKMREQEKVKAHKEAMSSANCTFFPFVLATRGTIGPKAESFIRTIAQAVQPFQQRGFIRTIHHAVATAAARGRADSVITAARRQRW
jgi:hypothetical protein